MTDLKIATIAEDFLAQLNLDMLRKQKNVKVDIYFDNNVVRSMILGISSIDNNTKINIHKFNSADLLVQSLAYFKLINNIRLLPPHQDELVEFLSQKFLLPDPDKINQEAVVNDLLYYVSKDIDLLRQYKKTRAADEYLKKFKPHSVQLYKANYILKDIKWNDRLKKVISFSSGSLVNIDNSTYDLNRAVSSKIFKLLVKMFDSEREEKSINNFRDALSLALIKEAVDEFKKNKKAPFPIFYASTNVIRSIRKNPDIYKEFNVQVKVKKESLTINALRDSYFFIIDSLFQEIEKDDKSTELFKKVQHIKTKYKRDDFNDIYKKAHIETEIENLIFKDKFILEFWFDRLKEDTLSDTLDDIVSYDFLKNDKSITDQIEKDRKSYSTRLSGNLTKLNIIEELWIALDEFPEEVENSFKRRNRIDVFTDLGLTRFSLIRCEEIQGITDIILRHNPKADNGDWHQAKTKLISYVINGIYKRDYEGLVVAISVFWVLNMYDLIVKLLGYLSFNYGSYYQLALLHAASIYPSKNGDKETVTKILNLYEQKHTKHKNYKLWIGAGFIYYHIWKKDWGKYLVPEENTSGQSEGNSYIYKAIDKTEQAVAWLKTNKDVNNDKKEYRNRKFYYALNNLLYFKVRINLADDSDSWKEFVVELEHCREVLKKAYWQPRFDHTLAMYEYRMYLINKERDGVKMKSHLNKAKRYITEALKGIAIQKEDYEKLDNHITNLLERDFPAPVNKRK